MSVVLAWAPNTAYALNAYTLRLTTPAAVRVPVAISNPGFESGATDWTGDADWIIDNSGPDFQGSWAAHCEDATGLQELINDTEAAVVPGDSITASCKTRTTGMGASARVAIEWLTAGDVRISLSEGNEESSYSWKESTVTATAPATAAKARIMAIAEHTGILTGEASVDDFSWTATELSFQPTLMFQATTGGVSGATEPVWPTALAGTVNDGTVVWTAVLANRVVWTMAPIMETGVTEPVWPTDVGGLVADNTIQWEAISRRVEDANCPNTEVVAIADDKVFAAYNDIVPYSATQNPLDWSTRDDAGYIASGMQQSGAGDTTTTALALYRGNLGIFSPSCWLAYQTDPDPANIQKLDMIPGIGSRYHRANVAVNNDLYFLTDVGVRSVTIAVGATNLAAGDVGVPVDPLVVEELDYANDNGYVPLGLYYPGAGQYWLLFPREETTNVMVHTQSQVGVVGAWSRYELPYVVDAHTQLAGDLYLRHGDVVSRVSKDVNYDEVWDGEENVPVYFDSIVQWAYLDFGAIGIDKTMEGFDFAGTGAVEVSVGFDQAHENDPAYFTDPYEVTLDNTTEGIVGLELTAPSMSLKLTFPGREGNFWKLDAFTLWLS